MRDAPKNGCCSTKPMDVSDLVLETMVRRLQALELHDSAQVGPPGYYLEATQWNVEGEAVEK